MATFTAADRVGAVGGYIGGISALGNIINGITGNGGAANACVAQQACAPMCSENMPVNRYELGLVEQIGAKDARIGLLESQVYVDQKLTEVVKDYTAQINNLASEVRANKDAQCAVNTQQAVFNGGVTSTLGCIEGQINQLFGITKLVVPNGAVCPGWGNVTITPATTTTPTA